MSEPARRASDPAPAGGAASALLPGEARDLRYRVGGRALIDGLDVVLPGGSLTVIMGPNGAGKSVLVRLLHGILAPTGGAVTWGGRPLSREVRERQAMVFQRPVLLRRSVRANLEFVVSLRRREARVDVDGLLHHVGLASRAGQSARRLSGGEQQRLALARALALGPEVLFLDEPTASLDPAATTAIEGIVRDAHRGGTKVVLVTHDVGQARRLADDVAFVNHGRVLEQTPAARFFAEPRTGDARDYLDGKLVF